MSAQHPDPAGFTPTGTIATHADRRRVVFATVIGTTVEWYDFFIYASAAASCSASSSSPRRRGVRAGLSFITVGVSFLFRPFGAFLAGHFGDKYGRRPCSCGR
jgi:MFS family permease